MGQELLRTWKRRLWPALGESVREGVQGDLQVLPG